MCQEGGVIRYTPMPPNILPIPCLLKLFPSWDDQKALSKASSSASIRFWAANSRAFAVTLQFGVRARVALMLVIVSDMKSSTRYLAKALSSSKVVEEKEPFFKLLSRMSAMV
jgi:hypothetical protein